MRKSGMQTWQTYVRVRVQYSDKIALAIPDKEDVEV